MRRLLIALALALSAASPAGAIFGGKPVSGGDPLAHSLAAVLYRSGGGAHLCSAVALGPKLVLTAAHCTEGDRADMRVIFATSLVGVGADRIREVSRIARPRPTAAAKGTYAYNNPDDVALILLTTPAPGDTQFVAVATALPADSTLRIAGYGATSDGKAGGPVGFDKQLRAATVSVKSVDSAHIAIDQSKTAGACTGDSGGPAFAGKAVAGLLVGVANVRGATDFCRGTAWYASLPRWRDWIVSTARDLH